MQGSTALMCIGLRIQSFHVLALLGGSLWENTVGQGQMAGSGSGGERAWLSESELSGFRSKLCSLGAVKSLYYSSPPVSLYPCVTAGKPLCALVSLSVKWG